MLFGTCKVTTGHEQPVHSGQHGCKDRAEEIRRTLVPSRKLRERWKRLAGLQPETAARQVRPHMQGMLYIVYIPL